MPAHRPSPSSVATRTGTPSNGHNRRRFLKTIGATSLVPMFLPGVVLGKDNAIAPNERITIAMFGMGNRGSSSWRAMKPLPDHQVVAVAECRRDRGLLAQKQIDEYYAQREGKGHFQACRLYDDFQEVLHRDDIDAVWGCVPDHWHGVLYSRILESGKDLYGEKPVSRWIEEGIHVSRAVRRYGNVFQTGTQQRSSPHFRHACELARNGFLGEVQRIEVGAPGGREYAVEPPTKPPEGFNYDMWSGPAPYIPFDPKRCEWLAMYMISHYCAGFITNWGVHHLDIAGWGCPEVFEESFDIEGTGVLPSQGMTDTWISWQMHLRWKSGLEMSYTNTGNPNKQGCKFVGTDGWVHVNRKGIWAEPASLLEIPDTSKTIRLHLSPAHENPYTAHTADFFHSIRTRNDPVSPIEGGHAASTLGNVSDIALRMGKKLTWNPQNQCFCEDDAANAMLGRALRNPWMI